MRLAIISTDYAPLRSSAAVQLRDLALEFIRRGHDPTLIVPAEGLGRLWKSETVERVPVLRLAAPRIKAVGHIRRGLGESIMPFSMRLGYLASPFRRTRWQGVIWYSPSIFFGPLVAALKRRSRCRSYLILRDIFPEWAADLELMKRGSLFGCLRRIARYQYSLADAIGVQTGSNLPYVNEWHQPPRRRVEVLPNWLAPARPAASSIQIASTSLAGRFVFAYIGNMGVAQSMDILLELAERMRTRMEAGFLFVGRGSEVPRLKERAARRGLDNLLFCDEVDPAEMPSLLAQCRVGLVTLDPRHRTHNIPGKFLTYMQAGLPVLARLNPGTDLATLIDGEGVGRTYAGDSAQALQALAEELMADEMGRQLMSERARALSRRMFSPAAAADRIESALRGEG